MSHLKYTLFRSQRSAVAGIVIAFLLLAGNPLHAASDRTQRIAIGTIVGALIGHEIDDERGALLGASIGAIAGSASARYQEAQRRELEAALTREHARDIEISKLQEEILAVHLGNQATFAFDSCEIRPSFHQVLDRLARSLIRYGHTFVHIVGHTDDTGPADYNITLSYCRAESVARFLIQRGVAPVRLRIVGMGESEPRRPNDTALHRQWNRRVDIYIRPIVEGEEYLASRLPDRRFTGFELSE